MESTAKTKFLKPGFNLAVEPGFSSLSRQLQPTLLPNRFKSKMKVEEDCWIWIGQTNKAGYGMYCVPSGKSRSTNIYAHRYSYSQIFGDIPEGLVLDHLCKVRNCVNPEHLEAVTNSENVKRGDAGKYNRNKTHCKRGHPLSGYNLRVIKSGGRGCRTCYNALHRKYYKNRKGGL